MKTYSGSPRHPQLWESHPAFAGNPPKLLRFKREDFEKTIGWLPPAKKDLARGLFSKQPGSRSEFMTADETRIKAFLQTLAPKELDIFLNLAHMDKMSMRPERSPQILKDSGRFTMESGPEARRPAKGENLKTPFDSHGAAPKADAKDADLYPPPGVQEKRPPSKAQDKPPAPSGNAQGKPNPASAEPKPKTLAEFLAEERAAEKASRGSQVPTQSQTQGQPKRHAQGQGQVEQTGQQNTSTKMSKTQKGILAGGAVLGTGLTIAGLTAAGLALTSKDEDSSSNAPAGT